MNTKSGCILHTYVCMHWVWAIRYYFTWSILLQAMTHLIIFLSIFVFALFRHICVCFVLCYWSVFFLLFIHLFTSLVFVPFLIIAFLIQWFYLVEQVWVWCWRKYLFAWFFSLLSMCINIFLFLFAFGSLNVVCSLLNADASIACRMNRIEKKKLFQLNILRAFYFPSMRKKKRHNKLIKYTFFSLVFCWQRATKKIGRKYLHSIVHVFPSIVCCCYTSSVFLKLQM